jgi:hypothetical protein
MVETRSQSQKTANKCVALKALRSGHSAADDGVKIKTSYFLRPRPTNATHSYNLRPRK